MGLICGGGGKRPRGGGELGGGWGSGSGANGCTRGAAAVAALWGMRYSERGSAERGPPLNLPERDTEGDGCGCALLSKVHCATAWQRQRRFAQTEAFMTVLLLAISIVGALLAATGLKQNTARMPERCGRCRNDLSG
jgi:hypothetical protein